MFWMFLVCFFVFTNDFGYSTLCGELDLDHILFWCWFSMKSFALEIHGAITDFWVCISTDIMRNPIRRSIRFGLWISNHEVPWCGKWLRFDNALPFTINSLIIPWGCSNCIQFTPVFFICNMSINLLLDWLSKTVVIYSTFLFYVGSTLNTGYVHTLNNRIWTYLFGSGLIGGLEWWVNLCG